MKTQVLFITVRPDLVSSGSVFVGWPMARQLLLGIIMKNLNGLIIVLVTFDGFTDISHIRSRGLIYDIGIVPTGKKPAGTMTHTRTKIALKHRQSLT